MEKMRKAMTASALVAGLVLIAVVVSFRADQRAAAPANPPHPVLKALPQMQALAREALAGSIPAADRLMKYYARCPEIEWRNEDERQYCDDAYSYWEAVALENGSPVAAQRRANYLLYSGNCEDAFRAEFWVPRFKDAFPGHPDLASSTRAEIEQKKRTCTWSWTRSLPKPVH